MQLSDGVYLGEIRIFAGNFAPEGWMFCDGSSLNVHENQALYSIIGNIYGGIVNKTFLLPDLRARVPIGMGSATGRTLHDIGDFGGTETEQLLINQMPRHTHSVSIKSTNPGMQVGTTVTIPAQTVNGKFPIVTTSKGDTNIISATSALAIAPDDNDSVGANINIYRAATGTDFIPIPVTIPESQIIIPSSSQQFGGGVTIEQTGRGDAHNNLPPFLAINFIIAVEGTYPTKGD